MTDKTATRALAFSIPPDAQARQAMLAQMLERSWKKRDLPSTGIESETSGDIAVAWTNYQERENNEITDHHLHRIGDGDGRMHEAVGAIG